MKARSSNRKNKNPRSSSARSPDTIGIPTASVFGCAVGLAAATAFALIGSLICMFVSDPDKLITPLAFICSILVFLISGFAAAKKKCAAIPCGLLSGAMLVSIFFIASLCMSDSLSSGYSLAVALLIRLSFLAVSVVGALIGVNSRPKRKRKH